MSGEPQFGRRRQDRRLRDRLRIRMRENWYRDVWLLAISGLVLLALSSSSDTSVKAQRAAEAARRLAVTIQHQRIENVRATCVAQDARHDATIRALDHLYGRRRLRLVLPGVPPVISRALGELLALQQRSSRAPTIFLINAVVPRQDCSRVVDRALGIRPARRRR